MRVDDFHSSISTHPNQQFLGFRLNSRQVLLAASYNLNRRITLDAGAARSVRRGDSSWQAFTGLTWLAARLF